jgi:hypothetical protein
MDRHRLPPTFDEDAAHHARNRPAYPAEPFTDLTARVPEPQL